MLFRRQRGPFGCEPCEAVGQRPSSPNPKLSKFLVPSQAMFAVGPGRTLGKDWSPLESLGWGLGVSLEACGCLNPVRDRGLASSWSLPCNLSWLDLFFSLIMEVASLHAPYPYMLL